MINVEKFGKKHRHTSPVINDIVVKSAEAFTHSLHLMTHQDLAYDDYDDPEDNDPDSRATIMADRDDPDTMLLWTSNV